MTTSADFIRPADLANRKDLLASVVNQALSNPTSRVLFFGRLAQWHGFFGAGVATLVGKVSRSIGMFMDPTEPVHALADRSADVAHDIRDASRINAFHGQAYRAVAQAYLKGLLATEALQDAHFADPGFVNALLASPIWLTQLCDSVSVGYGSQSGDRVPAMFHAMGYHAGFELLAAHEFSVIEEIVRARSYSPNACEWLSNPALQASASPEGFARATAGLRTALDCMPANAREAHLHDLHRGFDMFSLSQEAFYTQVLADRPTA